MPTPDERYLALTSAAKSEVKRLVQLQYDKTQALHKTRTVLATLHDMERTKAHLNRNIYALCAELELIHQQLNHYLGEPEYDGNL